MNKFLAGAAAGTLATVPMTLTMVWLHRQIPKNERRQLPPEQITMNIADELGLEKVLEDESEQNAVSLANHFAYGAAAGALYALLNEAADFSPAAKGVAFGLAVWTGSYLGWLPAVGILPPATEQPAKQNALMIAAHVVWGATLGAVFERFVSDGEQVKCDLS